MHVGSLWRHSIHDVHDPHSCHQTSRIVVDRTRMDALRACAYTVQCCHLGDSLRVCAIRFESVCFFLSVLPRPSTNSFGIEHLRVPLLLMASFPCGCRICRNKGKETVPRSTWYKHRRYRKEEGIGEYANESSEQTSDDENDEKMDEDEIEEGRGEARRQLHGMEVDPQVGRTQRVCLGCSSAAHMLISP